MAIRINTFLLKGIRLTLRRGYPTWLRRRLDPAHSAKRLVGRKMEVGPQSILLKNEGSGQHYNTIDGPRNTKVIIILCIRTLYGSMLLLGRPLASLPTIINPLSKPVALDRLVARPDRVSPPPELLALLRRDP